ncbi:MAG: hypothetical protein ACTSV7_15035 [Candidatus Baldrarchaeia archaeon]
MGLKLVFVDTKISEGKHTGTITRLERREVEVKGKQFEYLDVYIELDDSEGTELKYGCPLPDKLTRNNKLGKLVLQFRPDLELGEEVDLEKLLVGKRVSFMVMNEESDKGTFARIVDGSIKPIEEKEEKKTEEKPKEVKQQTIADVTVPKSEISVVK